MTFRISLLEIFRIPRGALTLLSALGFVLAAAAAGAQQVEVIDAWYGTPSVQSKTVGGVSVADRIRRNMQGGTVIVPANMNAFFGGDPAPNVQKGVVVTVRVQGQTMDLAQVEGKEFRYPSVSPQNYYPYIAPAGTAPAAPQVAQVEILDAWYGTPSVQSKTLGGVTVADRIRRNMQGGTVIVPANMNAFFGGDPAPNVQKGVVVTVRVQGQTMELAQIEGKEFRYPGVAPQNYYTYVAPAGTASTTTAARSAVPNITIQPATPATTAPSTTAPRSAVPSITIQPAPSAGSTANAPPPKSAQQLQFEADQAKAARDAADREAKGKADADAKAQAAAAQKTAEETAARNAAKMAADKQTFDENGSLSNIANALAAFENYTRTYIAALAGWISAPSQEAALKQLDQVDTNQSIASAGFEKTFQAASDVFARRTLDPVTNPVSHQTVGLEILSRFVIVNQSYATAKNDALTGSVVKFASSSAGSDLGTLYPATDTQQFCWRNTYGRGVGTIPTVCNADEEKLGALCYQRCPAGMERAKGTLDCHSVCPRGADGKTLPGWRDDGLFCRQYETTRGAGYPWRGADGFSNTGMLGRCNAVENQKGNSCEMWGAIAYPKCPPGSSPFGCCLCRPNPTPDCSKVGLGGKIDLSCAKKIQIGKPNLSHCPAGKVMDAGLCYDQCKAGYKGVGPVCWGNPPQNWVNCGMGAANSGKACDDILSKQFKAVGDLATSFKGFRSGGQEPDVSELSAQLKALKAAWRLANIEKEAQSKANKVDWLIDKLARTKAGATDATDSEIDSMPANTAIEIARVTEKIAAAALGTIGKLLGPAGGVAAAAAGAASAYTYPLCSDYASGARTVAAPTPPKPVTNPTAVDAEIQRVRMLADAEHDKCKFCQNEGDFCGAKLDMCVNECVSPQYKGKSSFNAPASYIYSGGVAACYSKLLISQSSCNLYAALYAPNSNCGPTPVVHQTRAAVAGAQPGSWPASCPAKPDASRPDCMRLAVESGDNQQFVAQANTTTTFSPLRVRLRWRDGAPVANYPVRFACVPVRASDPSSGCDLLGPRSNATDSDGIAQTDRMTGKSNSTGVPILVAVEAGGLDRCSGGKCSAYENEAIRAGTVTYFNLAVLTAAQKKAFDDAATTAKNKADVIAAADALMVKARVDNAAVAPAAPVAVVMTEPQDGAWYEIAGGTAHDIGAGVGGTVWIIGTNPVGSGYGIWYYDENAKKWVPIPGAGALRIDVDPTGIPWIVDGNGTVLRKTDTGWVNPVAAVANRKTAYDIGVGANGAVWIAGRDGGNVYRLNSDASGWELMPTTGLSAYTGKPGHFARRIDVDPQGNAWIIRYDNDVYRYTGSAWVLAPGIKANDIGIGADGSVFATGDNFSINQWTGSTWFRLTKGGDRRFRAITAMRTGQPLGTDQNSPYTIRIGYKLEAGPVVAAAPVAPAPTVAVGDPWAGAAAPTANPGVAACPATVDMKRLDCISITQRDPPGFFRAPDAGIYNVGRGLDLEVKWFNGNPISNVMVAFACDQQGQPAAGQPGCTLNTNNFFPSQVNASYGKRPLLFRSGADGVVRTYGFNVYNAVATAPVRLSVTLLPNCPAANNYSQWDEAPAYPAGCMESNPANPVTYYNMAIP